MNKISWKKAALSAAVILVCLLAGIVAARREPVFVRNPLVKITVAVAHSPLSAPVYAAQAQGYFRDAGLDVSLISHASGKEALKAMRAGKADFATAAETPLMFAALDKKDFCIVATIGESDRADIIIARKESGIAAAQDLAGKRIGVSPGTSGEFFLHEFLALNYISPADVTEIAVKPEEMGEALETGRVDTVAALIPYTSEILGKMRGRVLALNSEGMYKMLWNIAAGKDFTRKNPSTVKAFLDALYQAEKFIRDHPGPAREITARYTGLDETLIREAWDSLLFDLTLSEVLMVNLEDQARWALKEKYNRPVALPNFLEIIYTGGLEAVDPSAVTVTHR